MKPRIYPFGLSPQCPQEFRRRIVSYSGHGGEFKGDTGIALYKCDVSSYDACVAGLSKIEKDFGPVEVLVSGACYLTGRKNSEPPSMLAAPSRHRIGQHRQAARVVRLVG